MLAITSSSTSKIQATQTLTQKTQAVDFDGTASELTAFDPSDKSQVYSSSASQPTASVSVSCIMLHYTAQPSNLNSCVILANSVEITLTTVSSGDI